MVEELSNLSSAGEFVNYSQVPWIELESEQTLPINLDGEPEGFKTVRFEVVPGALKLIVPADCPLLSGREKLPSENRDV